MIEQNIEKNPNVIKWVTLHNDKHFTAEQLFAAIDLPGSIRVDDLRKEVQRAKEQLDPERERQHQEQLKQHAQFIEAAQTVIDVYAEDAEPHPQWSEWHLQRTLRNTQSELSYVTRQRDHYAQFDSDHIINWQTRGGERPQRNDDYQREVVQKIAELQVLIDQCAAILRPRGIEA